jgi:hypothetical protein
MNILSAIPALIASGTDLVERDVTANVEVIQGTQLFIPAVPMKHSLFLVSNGAVQGKQSSSFIYPLQVAQVGVNAGLASQILQLDKGLWNINVRGSYLTGTFVPVNNAPVEGFSITIGDGTQSSRLLTLQKNGSATPQPFDYSQVFLVNGFFSIVVAVAATIIGETALVDCIITGDRYL